MTTKTTKVKVAKAVKATPTKQELRDHLFGPGPKEYTKTRLITLFGRQLELRQPTLGQLLDVQDEKSDMKTQSGRMIIEYTCIPGTNERVFEDTDLAAILDWPFGEDLAEFNKAITELVGIDTEAAEEDLKANPS